MTIQKAREALIASNSDVSSAIEWIDRERVAMGQRKAEKVGGRFTGQGLVGVSVLSPGTGHGTDSSGVRAAMVELNCETDFVGRNELFRALTQNLAFTAAFISDPIPPSAADGLGTDHFLRSIDLSHLRDAPLMVRDQTGTPKTVSEAVRDTMTAVGENISIRRAMSFVHNHVTPISGVGLRASSYVHGALSTPPEKTPAVVEAQGTIGALVVIGLRTSPVSRLSELLKNPAFNTKIGSLERALARQVVGMHPEGVQGEVKDALYNQPFDMLATSGGQSVGMVLKQWAEEQNMGESSQTEHEGVSGLSVIEFSRWKVGEVS